MSRVAWAAALALWGCDANPPVPAAAADAGGSLDGAAVSDGAAPDAGAVVDLAVPDAAQPVDGAVDLGARDGAPPDAEALWPCDGPLPDTVQATCAADADCAEGDLCVAQDCCACEGGQWACPDPACVSTRCEPAPACGPDPSGCAGDGDCGAGEVCRATDRCPPVNCACIGGDWQCDAACGGECVPAGACAGPNPAGCTGDGDCPADHRCLAAPEQCLSSGCLCGDGGWVCLPDCGGGVCQPQVGCEGRNPQGCVADADCAGGARCVVEADVCRPTGCRCDAGAGVWACDSACGGGICEAASPCGVNPAGCTQTGCPAGAQCVRDPDQCAPSSCRCDAGSTTWVCTRDCGGGGACRPVD